MGTILIRKKMFWGLNIFLLLCCLNFSALATGDFKVSTGPKTFSENLESSDETDFELNFELLDLFDIPGHFQEVVEATQASPLLPANLCSILRTSPHYVGKRREHDTPKFISFKNELVSILTYELDDDREMKKRSSSQRKGKAIANIDEYIKENREKKEKQKENKKNMEHFLDLLFENAEKGFDPDRVSLLSDHELIERMKDNKYIFNLLVNVEQLNQKEKFYKDMKRYRVGKKEINFLLNVPRDRILLKNEYWRRFPMEKVLEGQDE